MRRTRLLGVLCGLALGCDGPEPLPPPPPETGRIVLVLSPDTATLAPGQSVDLAAEVRDSAGAPLAGFSIVWWTLDTAVASVSADGRVTARCEGRAVIAAAADGAVAYALVVVQPDFRLPLAGGRSWRLVTETGRPAGCPGGEGGARLGGGVDCTHAGASRYALDFDDWTAEDGSLAGAAVPVLAAADGVVRDVCLDVGGACGPRGTLVTVDHAGGFSTIYAHLETASVSIRRKTPVTRGQPLGVMGASGSVSDVRLHFEVRHGTLGSTAAAVLDAFRLDGRAMVEYRVTGDAAPFYPSSNGGEHQ